MDIKWYGDEDAKRLHNLLSEELKPIMARMCPSYELSHVGINRHMHDSDMREEIIIKLHLNPIGSVKVVSDNNEHRGMKWIK
jgi:hypothetical protein